MPLLPFPFISLVPAIVRPLLPYLFHNPSTISSSYIPLSFSEPLSPSLSLFPLDLCLLLLFICGRNEKRVCLTFSVFVLALSFAPFEISQSIRGTQFLKCSCFLPIVVLHSFPTFLLLILPSSHHHHGRRSLINTSGSNNVNIKGFTRSTSFSSSISQQLDYYRVQIGHGSVKLLLQQPRKPGVDGV